jgi:hypothetical protein
MLTKSFALVALVAATTTLQGQGLNARVVDVRDGTVRLQFPAAEGVCGNGRNNISIRHSNGSTSRHGTFNRSRDEWEDECEAGPVRLAIDVARGRVTEIRAYVGGRWRGDADRDLGTVAASEASAWLLDVAARGETEPAKDAIFPAMLADVPNPWRALLDIAKDDNRPRDVRTSATFWVGQAAGEAATAGLAEVVESNEEKEVRKSAVFALSQRRDGEAVPSLIRIARTNRDPEIRKSAIFWLGQSRDPRALSYFEEILLGRR